MQQLQKSTVPSVSSADQSTVPKNANGIVSGPPSLSLTVDVPTQGVGSGSADPFFHRDHPMLYVSFKLMTPVRIKEPISAWMSSFFGAGAASQEDAHLTQMEANRNKLCSMSQCIPEKFSHQTFENTYLPACSAYISDVESLLVKTHGTAFEGGLPNLHFLWSHWLGPEYGQLNTNSLVLELACVLFNLAAAYSLMGCLLPETLHAKSRLFKDIYYNDHRDVLTYRCKMFRISAILFDYLKRRIQLAGPSMAVDDISPIISEMFSSVMLAQAQTCFYHLYKDPNPTPTIEKQYAQILLAASSYYNDFLVKYESLKRRHKEAMQNVHDDSDAIDGEDPPMPLWENIPQYWVLHCSVVRALLRANILVHVSRFNKDDVEKFGYCVGYTGKAFVIVDDQAKDLLLVEQTPPIQKLRQILETKLAILKAMHSVLHEENRTIYKCQAPSKSEIDSLKLIAENKVAIGENPDLSSVPLLASIMKRPKDSFPSIMSLASARAWLNYRAARIERVLVHLKAVKTHNDILFTVLEHHAEYLLLYFVRHRISSFVANTPPIGLYQSKLGGEMLAVRNPSVIASLRGICERDHPDAISRVERSMARLQTSLSRVKVVTAAEVLERRVGILADEHDFCTKSQAGQALVAYRHGKEQYNWASTSEYGNSLADTIFGTCKSVLFDLPKTPAPPTDPKPSNSSTGLLSSFWPSSAPPQQMAPPATETSSSPDQKIPEMEAPLKTNVACYLGDLVVELIDKHFLAREKIEDELAAEMLRNVQRKDMELNERDISDVNAWIEREIGWLIASSQTIFDHINQEKHLLEELEKADPGIEVVIEHLNHLLLPVALTLAEAERKAQPKQTTTSPGHDQKPVQQKQLTEIVPSGYSAKPLWDVFHSTINFKHAKRFASLCKHMEDSVEIESDSICRQCDDVLVLARNNSLKPTSMPPSGSTSVFAANSSARASSPGYMWPAPPPDL